MQENNVINDIAIVENNQPAKKIRRSYSMKDKQRVLQRISEYQETATYPIVAVSKEMNIPQGAGVY